MLFNPENELIKKQYEEALLHGKYRDPKTVRAVWSDINLFEQSTGLDDFKNFSPEQAKGFKHLLEKKTNQKGQLLSISTARSTLHNLREFFEWLAMHPKYIRKVDARAIQYLRLSDNANRAARASREAVPPTLDELEQTLRAMPDGSDIEKRDKSLFALTIVTCVRDDALVTLKLKDIDVVKKTVWQNPRHVRTKRRKGIVTGFVGVVMPYAEEVVLEWVRYISDELHFQPNDPLFPKTLVKNNPDTFAYEVLGLTREHWANAQPVRDIFKRAFEAADLPYYHPHLLRKTVCKWALKHCTQLEYKALSQNIGHDHAMTTYNAYGQLSEDEQLEAVRGIGTANSDLQAITTEDIMAELSRRMCK